MDLTPAAQQALARDLLAALEGSPEPGQLKRLRSLLPAGEGEAEASVIPLPRDLFAEVQRRAEAEGTTTYEFLISLIENSLTGRLKRRPGPPKGRALKIRQGGDWTPMLLRVEMQRLGLSEARLAKAMGVSSSAVHKWATLAIPDDRQDALTSALRTFEEGF